MPKRLTVSAMPYFLESVNLWLKYSHKNYGTITICNMIDFWNLKVIKSKKVILKNCIIPHLNMFAGAKELIFNKCATQYEMYNHCCLPYLEKMTITMCIPPTIHNFVNLVSLTIGVSDNNFNIMNLPKLEYLFIYHDKYLGRNMIAENIYQPMVTLESSIIDINPNIKHVEIREIPEIEVKLGNIFDYHAFPNAGQNLDIFVCVNYPIPAELAEILLSMGGNKNVENLIQGYIKEKSLLIEGYVKTPEGYKKGNKIIKSSLTTVKQKVTWTYGIPKITI
jgi:hypothetical protein